jgi:antitoxin CcdA
MCTVVLMTYTPSIDRTRSPSRQVRHAANVTLPEPLAGKRSRLVSTCPRVVKKASRRLSRRPKGAAWLNENGPALEAWNDYVEAHGIPLAEFRRF